MKIAVIKAKGHQYLVREGDLLKVPTLSLQEGDTAVFDPVLYLDGEMVILGIEYMLCSGPTGSIPNLPCRREPSCIKAC